MVTSASGAPVARRRGVEEEAGRELGGPRHRLGRDLLLAENGFGTGKSEILRA